MICHVLRYDWTAYMNGKGSGWTVSEKELSTESFRFNIKVTRTEHGVVKMERVEWYDPITGRDMSKNISELYILDSQEM